MFCTDIEQTNKLLLEHVGTPHIFVLAVHQVNLFGWIGPSPSPNFLS